MRRLISLLLLAAAAPALAGEPEGEQPRGVREAHSERPMRAMAERIERAEREEPAAERQRPAFERPRREERQQRQVVAREAMGEPAPLSERQEERRSAAPPSIGDRDGDRLRERVWRERSGERRRSRDLPQATPSLVLGDVPVSPRSVEVERALGGERRQDRLLRNRIATEGWRREWREDRRFDWRRHRDRDRSRFRVGVYIDPFGWGYRRWNLGWHLPSRFYSDRYWIRDPFHYRLPPAYGPYRWVRYWDDALLIDLRTGRVVDVLHNFFW